MSEYQKRKAQAMLIQQEKEGLLRRELAEKALREKEVAKAEDERRKRQEAASKEARRLELVRANAALNRDPSGADDAAYKTRLAYDPFAEDERHVSSPMGSGLKLNSMPKAKKLSMSGENQAGPSRLGSTNVVSTGRPRSQLKGSSPVPLSRKEKAAQDFAKQAMKSTASDSLFSARSLYDLPPSTRTSNPPASSQRDRPLVKPPMNIINSASTSVAFAISGKSKKGKGSMAGLELRKLAPDRDKWDRRTIDEIHMDLKKQAKGKEKVGGDHEVRKDMSDFRRNRDGSTTSEAKKRSNSPNKIQIPPSSSKAIPRTYPIVSHRRDSPSSPLRKKRRRSPSSSSGSSVSSSTSSISSRPHHKRLPPRGELEEEEISPSNISAQIQALFRRPGRPPPPKRMVDSDSDSGTDMEVGLNDLEREERETARIARLEDEEDERRERRRKEEKERLKREREKGGGRK